MLNKIKLVLFVVTCFLISSTANAVTIIQVQLGGFGHGYQEIEYVGSSLSTIDDSISGTAGDQDTNVLFDGFLSSIADITSGASFTLAGISTNGGPSVAGPIISQNTIGGSFSLYDASNTLLLSGNLSDGVLIGSDTGSTGTFFNTTFGNFNGGTLLSLIPNINSLYLSLVLGNIQTAGAPGLDVDFGIIQNFSGNGQITIDAEASAVPEPTTLGLLLTASLTACLARARKIS